MRRILQVSFLYGITPFFPHATILDASEMCPKHPGSMPLAFWYSILGTNLTAISAVIVAVEVLTSG